MATRTVTREQAERKKSQAAAFMERIGDDDRADEFDDMSIDEYAERRGLQIANPRRKERKTNMAGAAPTKADLQDTIDSAIELLNEAYNPEITREDMAVAVGQALDILNGDDEDEDDSDDDLDEGDEADDETDEDESGE